MSHNVTDLHDLQQCFQKRAGSLHHRRGRQVMDPALIDRTIRPIVGVSDAEQPVRPMTISGIEESVHAKILSANLRGAGTRIVRLTSGWGSRLAGAFTADVEVFVLKGDIRVGAVELTDYEYAFIPNGSVVGGFRTETGATALLMTSGPVRYDTSTGGAAAKLVVGRPGETKWEREWKGVDLFARALAITEISRVWLGSTQLSADCSIWHEHAHDEESFLLEGEMSCVDLSNGRAVITAASPGSYFYRPAGTRHTAPVTVGEETVLTFHRSLGPHKTDLIDGDTGHE